MPEFPIVDAHLHLYDPATIDFQWMKSVPKLDRPYLPEDFRALTAGVDVEILVFVEVDAATGQPLREAEWVARQAETEADVAPYIAHAIDCFGFDRVIFGGDWPVSELASTYRHRVAVVDSLVAGASETERRKLYRDNAIAFYRL